MFGKYYKANIYGFKEDFKITSDDVKENIYKGNSVLLDNVIVKKSLFGFREIVTGKQFYTLRLDDEKEYFDINPLFIIDDRENYSFNLKEVTKEEIVEYCYYHKNNLNGYMKELNSIEQESLDNYKRAVFRREIDKITKIDRLRR